MISLDYRADAVGVEAVVPLDNSESVLRFRASDLRRERTGMHGRLSILVDDYVLTWTQCNLERAEERKRLVNSAMDTTSGKMVAVSFVDGIELNKEQVQHAFDQFCLHAWDKWLSQFEPTFLHGDNTPLSFIAHPHCLDEAGTIIYAPPDRGKSYVAITLGICVDQGISDFWEIAQPRPTLLINLERGQRSIQRRISNVNFALGCDPRRPLLTLTARGRSLMDVKEIIARAVDKHKIEFVILDSISRAGAGDLTDNAPATKIMDTLNAVCPSWFAIAHTPRADSSHIFGSHMFDAAADVTVELTTVRRDDSLAVGLRAVKGNDLSPKEKRLMVMEFQFDGGGLSGIKKSSESKFPELTSKKSMSTTDEIEEWLLDEAGKASATDIANALDKDRSTVARILKNDPKFVDVGKEGKSVLYGVKHQ